ncbi:MAG: hypothetical protein HC880_18770 [Bacteroidia bacterium]|nr:hypothetical protein [Bacteroidia bacterium]
MTKGQGGFFADADGGTKISVKEIDPVVYFTIDTMQVGGISPPVSYRTDDGKSAVRLIYYKSRVAPHQANLDKDYDKLYNYALSNKQNEALNQWFIETKDELYIYVDQDFNYCNILGVQ